VLEFGVLLGGLVLLAEWMAVLAPRPEAAWNFV
jgi:hypothetical protein